MLHCTGCFPWEFWGKVRVMTRSNFCHLQKYMLNFSAEFLFVSWLQELLLELKLCQSHPIFLLSGLLMLSGVGAARIGWQQIPLGCGSSPCCLAPSPCVRYPPNLPRSLRQVLFALVLTNHSWHPPTAPDWQELTILINSEQRGAAVSRLSMFRFRAMIWNQQEGAQLYSWLCPHGFKPGTLRYGRLREGYHFLINSQCLTLLHFTQSLFLLRYMRLVGILVFKKCFSNEQNSAKTIFAFLKLSWNVGL